MNQKNEKAQGCACTVDMEKKVDDLVKEGTKPTQEEHSVKKKEVEAAFDKDK